MSSGNGKSGEPVRVGQGEPTVLFCQLSDFILKSGGDAMDALARIKGEAALPLQRLVDAGLLTHRDHIFGLTARAVRQMERQALADVVARMDKAAARPAGAKNDERAISDHEMTSALRQTLVRGGAAAGASCPLQLDQADIDRYAAECVDSASVALLVDMSYSMSRFGRFYHAKKLAMAINALVRQRFPEDSIDVIGFYTRAETINLDRLPLLMPRPVSLTDKQLSLRLPLDHAGQAPQHLTNLQMALDLADQTLARRHGRKKHAFIVLDGEPTAFLDGNQLVLRYPPDEETAAATLRSARALADNDVMLTTFALIDDYYYMDWVAFVDRMTRATRGVSFYCVSEELPGCALESYIAGKR
jgi:Ca-activated chloride channel family protein